MLGNEVGVLHFALCYAIGHLFGSIPCGLWIVQALHGIDIREYGSKNIGTTNVFRTVGGKSAAIVMAADMIKGIVAVALVGYLFNNHMKNEQKNALLSKISEGSVIEGTVKNVTDFGAFIDLGGLDGLLHISEMSWGRVDNPKKIYKVGDVVKAFVKEIKGDITRVIPSINNEGN